MLRWHTAASQSNDFSTQKTSARPPANSASSKCSAMCAAVTRKLFCLPKAHCRRVLLVSKRVSQPLLFDAEQAPSELRQTGAHLLLSIAPATVSDQPLLACWLNVALMGLMSLRACLSGSCIKNICARIGLLVVDHAVKYSTAVDTAPKRPTFKPFHKTSCPTSCAGRYSWSGRVMGRFGPIGRLGGIVPV